MTIRNSLILAAVFLAFTFATLWAEKAGFVSDEIAKRAVSIAAGLVAVYYANLVPKTLESHPGRCSSAKTQALQRFSGWTLVLGGLGYSLAWLVLPFDQAGPVAIGILGTGVLVVAARLLWILTRRKPSAGP